MTLMMSANGSAAAAADGDERFLSKPLRGAQLYLEMATVALVALSALALASGNVLSDVALASANALSGVALAS